MDTALTDIVCPMQGGPVAAASRGEGPGRAAQGTLAPARPHSTSRCAQVTTASGSTSRSSVRHEMIVIKLSFRLMGEVPS